MLRVNEYFAKSLKVAGNGIIRQIAYEFLLAFHSNDGPILYHFRDKASVDNNATYFIPPAFDAAVRETSEYCDNFSLENQNGTANQKWKKFDDIFSRIDTIVFV